MPDVDENTSRWQIVRHRILLWLFPPDTRKDLHDYVEYQLDIEDGKIVGCRYFGEGKQAEPLNGVKAYRWSGHVSDHLLRRIERLFRTRLS